MLEHRQVFCLPSMSATVFKTKTDKNVNKLIEEKHGKLLMMTWSY